MRIYRFIPNNRSYPVINRNFGVCQWWPEGIDLGRMAERFPRGDRWVHEGNRFSSTNSYPWFERRPFSDFPALALNVPILSPRALEVLSRVTKIDAPVRLTVDDQPFFAVQPHVIPGVFDAEASNGLTMPDGEIYFYYRRHFDVSKVDIEFFAIEQQWPCSDLFVTDRLVDAAAAAGLTGLELLELVYDEHGPVVPKYSGVVPKDVSDLGRWSQDSALIHDRNWDWHDSLRRDWAYRGDEMDQAVAQAIGAGYIASSYRDKPTYER